MEVVVQHRRVEEEEEEEELLPRRRRRADSAASIVVEESSVLYEVESSSTTVSTTTVAEEHGAIVSKGATTTTSVDQEEMGGGGVEVIELKYDSSKEVTEVELGSFRAHSPHCPLCSLHITKVILRKRNIPRFKRSPVIEKIQTTHLRKGKFESAMIPSSMAPQHSAASQINGKHGYDKYPARTLPKTVLYEVTMMKNDKHLAPHRDHRPPPEHDPDHDLEAGPKDPIVGGRPHEVVSTGNNNVGDQRSRSLEFLKCVVYGGLKESIVSFSIVSSAAASDATTLNVVVIGLASLFSGLVVFGSNLVELRNENSNEKYERVLGKKGHFAFHSTLAVLSYIVFGLIAPITYGFAFPESGDKDYKILAVTAAAFVSVFLLSIAKAYASRGRDGYVKTILCYIMLAVSSSGVAYAAGDLIGDVMNTIGMFRDHVPAPGSGWASY